MTFVEIVITVVLLGTVAITMLTVARASIRTSQTNEEAANVQTALIAAADRVQRFERPGTDAFCGGLTTDVESAVRVALDTPPPSSSGVVVDYEHLVVDATGAGDWQDVVRYGDGSYDPCCPVEVSPDCVQRVTLTVTGPENGLQRSLVVVKSDR